MSDPLGLFDVTKSAWWKYVPPGLRGALLGSDDYTQAQPSPGLPAYSTRKPTGGAVALAGETTPGADLRDYGHFSQSAYENFGRGAVSQGFVDSAYSAAALASMVLPFSIAGIFGGRGARTADVVALRTAEEMERKGIDADAIWRETGWGRGADGKWRFEIDDSASTFREYDAPEWMKYGNQRMEHGGRVGDVLGHDNLYSAYDAPNVTTNAVVLDPKMDPRGSGAYSEKTGLSVAAPTSERAQNVMLHELQHYVQNAEDFARGGNLESSVDDIVALTNEKMDAVYRQIAAEQNRLGLSGYRPKHPALQPLYDEYDALMDARAAATTPENRYTLYRRLAGEVEARNVQTRADWSAERRRQTPPWETEDVPRISQIIRYR